MGTTEEEQEFRRRYTSPPPPPKKRETLNSHYGEGLMSRIDEHYRELHGMESRTER